MCRGGENEELRYSIRSVVKHYPDSRIFLFGDAPKWFIGNVVVLEDLAKKFENITSAFKAISEHEELSDFILMNDDFFILNNNHIDFYYDGLLINKIDSHTQKHGMSQYAVSLISGYKALEGLIDEPLNYEVHIPMPMNRDRLKKIVDLSTCPRSVYGNYYNVGGQEIKDVKVYKDTDVIKGADFISTEDNSFEKVYNEILKDMFPDKSKYEL